MKPVLNKLLPLAVSLLVVLTGQGIAASRGMDNAVGQMVLCTSTGPVVVYMDADGQPTQPPHFCPEYAITLLGAIAVAAPVVPTAPDAVKLVLLRKADSLIAQPIPNRPARSPPMKI